METSGKCAVCDAECSFKCTACKCVSYCGIEHQKKDWKTHKLECRPLEVAHSDELGRYIIASRDIKAKTVIFTEAPLIAGPKWCMEDYERQEPIFPCVGCFKPVRIDQLGCPRFVFKSFYGLHCTVNGCDSFNSEKIDCLFNLLHTPSTIRDYFFVCSSVLT